MTISVFGDVFGIDEARSMDPDGADVTVAGRPGYMVGSDLHVETSAGTVSFTAILPDTAFEAGIVAADIIVPVAELVVAAIEADLADG